MAEQALQPPGGRIILITGNMASGKSSVAQALAERLPRSVHLRGDLFRRMIINGRAEMGVELSAEAEQQLQLRYTLAAEVARRYAQEGFSCMADRSAETHGVARLTVEQIPQVAAVLARAFQDDPGQHYVFPTADERARLQPVLFRVVLQQGLRAGEVWTTAGAPAGAAAWEPWGWAENTHDEVEQADPNELQSAIGTAASERVTSFFAYLGALHRRDVPGRHWYLSCLGVDPAHQSQGVGSSLLQPILARAAAEGVPCYLETTQPKAVPFYRRHGFEVLVEDIEANSGVRIWTFRRD